MKAILTYLIAFSFAFSEPVIEFKGRHKVQSIAVGVNEGTFKKLTEAESNEYLSIVTELDGKYFWTSRENKEIIKMPSGIYILYLSVEGNGFIKAINPELKKSPEWKTISKMLTDTEIKFDYIEVLHTGLKTVTYFGTIK